MSFRIGVDIGGTFTDCVVVDDDGHRAISKALTTHGALYDGVINAVTVNAEERGFSLEALLTDTTQFVHGTTVATNAVLTRRGAKTGLITTRGHEDALIIGKVFAKSAGLDERELIHASQLHKPDPIVQPEHIFGVVERIDVEGEILAPLNEDSVLAAVDAAHAAGLEALAVCLLWSFVNDTHERRIARLLLDRAPDLFCTYSHELAPVLGEYERTVTTVLNAYVGPEVSGYLLELERRLHTAGLEHPLLVMQASDGLTSVTDACLRPIVTLDSGPTGGILGCQYLSGLYGEPNMICTDVGGTSFDVGLITAGQVPLEDEPVVSQFSFKLPKVAVRSIGAGGGSIGWVDDGGVLRVGPQSAGSRPGPACYGQGGDAPTVTDADLALGYFDPGTFLGGRMQLDTARALDALDRIGKQLGMDVEQVAIGMVRIINAHMADLIRRATIEQGNDPRECVLIAYGGAGPTHAGFYGAEINAKAILIPADSTVFSAEGMLTCQVVHSAEISHAVASPFDLDDYAALSEQFGGLEKLVENQFHEEGTKLSDVALRRTLKVRYGLQVHTVSVEVPSGILDLEHGKLIQERFEERYAQIFGAGSLYSSSGLAYEACRVTGTLDTEPLRFAPVAQSTQVASIARNGERRAYFEQLGFVSTPVFDGNRLQNGHVITGPAIIERMGDSVVVPPGISATMDQYRSLLLQSRNISEVSGGEPS
ncbi:MAG: hydantoinase/oxoprolinase family protein [Gammaproteobacteria bacterium]